MVSNLNKKTPQQIGPNSTRLVIIALGVDVNRFRSTIHSPKNFRKVNKKSA